MGVIAQNQITVVDITDAYSVILSNENQTFREASLNGGTTAQTVSTTVCSYRGSTNVWSYIDSQYLGSTHANNDGVYITIDSPNTNPAQDLILTIHIPAGLINNGSINIPIEVYETSSTSGSPLIEFTKTFTYSVARYGSTGAAAVIYELEYTGNLFNFSNESGTFLSPQSITITASSQEGTNAKQAYSSGTITVTPYTTNGTTGTSQSHTTAVTITPTATGGEPDYLYYVATLTVDNNIVDRQTIGINRQGANGVDGINAYSIDITSSNGFTFKNATIDTTLTAHVYSGGTELTASDLAAMGLQVSWYENNSIVATSTGLTKTYSIGSAVNLLHVVAKLEDTTTVNMIGVSNNITYAQSGCTLSTITDVQAVYTYYHLSDSTITINEAPKDNVNPPGASSITVISEEENYIWTLVEPELTIINNVIQEDIGKLYVIECVLFSDETYDWGPLMTSSTYAAAKAAYNLSSQALSQAQAANNATALLAGHFIYNSNWQTTNTPYSANVVQTILKNGIDVSETPSEWQHNVHIGANGIKLRYNEIDLSKWTTDGITLYHINQSLSSQGQSALRLSINGLQLFNRSNNNNDTEAQRLAATLNTNGLILEKGGIKAGTAGQSGFIYLSSENFSEVIDNHGAGTVSLDNYNATDWRQLIGTKFGVRADGTLYATNANISGKVTVGVGSNVYTTDNVNPLEIGGRNLVLNSKDMKSWRVGTSASFTTDGDSRYVTLTGTTTNWASQVDIYPTRDLDLLDGSPMMLSFEYKASADWQTTNIVCAGTASVVGTVGTSAFVARTKYTSLIVDASTVLPTTSTWKKASLPCRSITPSMMTSGSGDVNSWYVQIYNYHDNLNVSLRNIKLEKGTKATDWSPAPEDMATMDELEVVDLKHSVETLNNDSKLYKNVASFWSNNNPYTGYIAITTPITPNRMNNIHITGYNYAASSAGRVIDINVGFYNYTTSMANATFTNNGDFDVNEVRVAKVSSSDTRAVIILGTASKEWRYPRLLVDEALVTYSSPPDSYVDGWSISTLGTSIPSTYAQTLSCNAYNASKTATSYITHIGDNGIRVHPSSTENNSVVINASGMEVFKGGTTSANSIAFYGDTTRIGQTGTRHIEIANDGFKIFASSDSQLICHIGYGLVNIDNGTSSGAFYDFGIRSSNSNIGLLSVIEGTNTEASGYASHAEGERTVANKSYCHAEGAYTKATEVGAHAEGYNTTASGLYSHAEGESTIASGTESHAEGCDTTASGLNSHAEGDSTIASGTKSHAEGYNTTANESNSHAEGDSTIASGSASHAEGYKTTARGLASHAEGYETTAGGFASHASGYGTIASGMYQTAIGLYNVEDYDNLFIIGKGTASTSRANAFAVSNTGQVFVNGTSVHSSDRRLKEHISYLNDEAISFINELKPVYFIKEGEKHIGFYAQDIAEIDKWNCLTSEDSSGYMTLSYMELIAPLVKYCQHLEKRIEQLENKI